MLKPDLDNNFINFSACHIWHTTLLSLYIWIKTNNIDIIDRVIINTIRSSKYIDRMVINDI